MNRLRNGIRFGAGLVCLLSLSIVTFGQGKKLKVSSSTFGAVEARHIGPATMSGRIAALDAVENDPRILYVGSAGGGVWKSTNAGTTFESVFDKHTQAVGAVRIDQKHPDTVWVGTGEPWTRNSTSVGTGIYKTTNGGDKWKLMGLEDTERIGRILIHPKDPDVVFVAALGHLWGPNEERGVFKTADGGKTWEKILYVNENTGCADLAFEPGNPSVIYAGMWQFRRKAWTFESGGEGSGLYKSTDGGKTWNKLTKDLPEGKVGRVAVATTPTNPNRVYTIIESEKTTLYVSDDKGGSWKEMNKSAIVGERPFYFSQIVTDPVEEDRIYKPGFMLYMSEDAGKVFRGASVEGGNVHSDLHAMWISSKDNSFMYLGTDGGVYVSRDKANTWSLLRNLPVSQFYRVHYDLEAPYNVYGGLQDNGSWTAPSRSPGGIENSDWKNVGFGDGFNCYPDPSDPNLLYWQYQGGNIYRLYRESGESKDIKPYAEDGESKLRFNWNAPLTFSPDGQRMYMGAQHLYRSVNRGDSWEKISPDLTTNDPEKLRQEESGGLTVDNSTAENHCTIFTVSESPLDKNIIWVGTDDGNLQVTSDGGKNWSKVSANISGLPVGTWCSSVYASKFDKAIAYATFDGHRNDDKAAHVYKTTDMGKTWVSLADKNIEGYCHSVVEDPVNRNLIYLGTEFGFYVSINGGGLWSQFKGNLPNVSIREVKVHPREHDIILATHGRGILIIDDITPLRNFKEADLDKDLVFLDSKPFVIKTSGFQQGFNGDDEFVGRNPQQAAAITYYMKKRHIFGDMFVEVYDMEDNLISRLPAGKRKGINRVYWAVRKKPPRVPASNTLAVGAIFGPNYSPGNYKVKIVKENVVYENTITLVEDDQLPHSKEDRAIQLETVNKAYDMLEELAFLDAKIVKAKKEAEGIKNDTDNSGLEKKLSPFIDALDNFHKELVATKVGRITGEEQLRERISTIYGAVIGYNGRPTQSQMDRLDALGETFHKKEEEINAYLKEALPKLNKAISKADKKEIVLLTRSEFENQD